MIILLARELDCDYCSFKVVLPGKEYDAPANGGFKHWYSMSLTWGCRLEETPLPIRVMFIEIPSHSEFWYGKLSCLWWSIMIYEVFLLHFLSKLLWVAWFNVTQARCVIMVRMYVFTKFMILFIFCMCPHILSTYLMLTHIFLYGPHSYHDVGSGTQPQPRQWYSSAASTFL